MVEMDFNDNNVQNTWKLGQVPVKVLGASVCVCVCVGGGGEQISFCPLT